MEREEKVGVVEVQVKELVEQYLYQDGGAVSST